LIRPLGSPEHLYRILNHLGFNIVTNVARIIGFVNPDLIEQALDCVYQHHPMLRVCLFESNQQFNFQAHEQKIINFQVVHRKNDTQWLELAEQEIQTVFNPTHSLWRVILLTSTQHDESELIFTYHHAIADGVSSYIFIHELLSFYHQLAEGKLIPTITSLPILPAAKVLFPGRLKLRYLLKKLDQMIRPPQVIIEKTAPIEQRQTQIIPRSLDRETTQRLKQCCHQAGTTVHGALCAAMLLGTAKIAFHQKSVRLLCDSSVNLRQLHTPNLGYANIGSLSSVVEITHTLKKNPLFWDLAKECKVQIGQSIRRQEPQSWLSLLERLKLSEAFVIKLAEQKMGRSSTVAISNIGQYPFPNVYGEISLKSVHFVGGIHGIGACLWLGVTTCEDEMACSFAYAYPLISHELALQISDAVLNMLLDACQ
jgi:NRPS condensation-like uncharacterized protein